MRIRSVFNNKAVLEARRSTMKRRAQVALRPFGENLEGRALMASLGLDPTFGFGGTASVTNPVATSNTTTYTYLNDVAVQSDGKILAVGYREVDTTTPSSTTYSDVVERLNPDGTLDTTYGSGGVFVVPRVTIGADTLDMHEVAATLQSDGKLVILANATGMVGGNPVSDFEVVRLLQNGSLDTSFGSGGYQSINFSATATPDNTAQATSIAIGPLGQIVVAGYYTNPTTSNQDFAVAQLLGSNGSLDTGFGTGGKQTVAFDIGALGYKNDEANAVVIQPDNKVVLVGSADVGPVVVGASTYTNTDIAVARLTAQGALDTSFGSGGKTTISYDLGFDNRDVGNSVALLSNQIVIGGTSDVSQTASQYSTTATLQTATLTRLSMTAAISSKYSLNLVQQAQAFSTQGSTLNVLADGSLLLGGYANSFMSSAGGQYFTNFFAGGGVNTAYGTNGTAIINGTSASGNVAVQPDGKLVFANYQGVSRTTAPAPVVVTAQLVMPNTNKNAKSNTIVVHFNTALNPTLANNKKSYLIKVGKRGRPNANMIRRVRYDAATQSVTITLKQKFNRKAQLFVVVNPVGLASADSQFLNNGQNVTIPIVVV